MSVSAISNSVNFRGNIRGNGFLCTEEVAPIKAKAKEFENKLTIIGGDEFVRRHQEARSKELGIFMQAKFCIDGRAWDTKRDDRFGTPMKRFSYLLSKARKYQTNEAINAFTHQKEAEYEKNVSNLRENISALENQLTESRKNLQNLLENKGSIIRKETVDWMNKKLNALRKFYKESQEISDYHREVQEDLDAGRLP